MYIHKSINKRLGKIYKIAVSLQEDCSGVSSLIKVKDAATEIGKLVKNLYPEKQIPGR